MRHIRHALNATALIRSVRPLWLAYLGAVVLFGWPALSQSAPVIDLTKEVLASERGQPGIPGLAGGGGGTSVKGPSRYRLPLAVQVLQNSVNEKGEVVVAVLVRNTGSSAFDLPVSRNITEIQKAGNSSQRMFFFDVQTVTAGAVREGAGGGVTAGSTSISASFVRLDPGSSLEVLLPTSQSLLRNAFTDGVSTVRIRVVCNEWKLEDTSYFLQATSEEVVSTNMISLGLRDGKVIAPQP